MAKKDKAGRAIAVAASVLAGAYVTLDVASRILRPQSVYADDPSQQNSMEGCKVRFVDDAADAQNADGFRGHLEPVGPTEHREDVYERYMKRAMDKALSFGGLVLLSPIMAGIALAIKVEDPGPALFVQKRVGKDKQYFKLHKFRSMRMDTPHDVPTHMLDNPEHYITRVGRFIRRHSLDELPQIWDIFMGNMAVIGPRPALWNQDVLVSERDRYGANDVRPGLTGWAQINGRDELELQDKARLDGQYVYELRRGGVKAAAMDVRCFLGSVGVFAKDDSVVEGGTGELERESAGRSGVPSDDPAEHFACDHAFSVDGSAHKRVLVVGSGSYIGESFESYAKQHYPDNLTITTVGTLPGEDGTSDFDRMTEEQLASYDVVYHLAGIAHADVGSVSDEVKERYYAVNTDLAIATARRCKEAGVSAFILMSSMIVYGDSAPYGMPRVITRDTEPSPANYYGDSKWQADKGVRALADEGFRVYVLRPPMIYGRSSKGNYPVLARLAKSLPAFPDVENERSMLYVENLCEFLCQLMLSEVAPETQSLVFMPQNAEFTQTSEMVREIAEASGHAIQITKALTPAVLLADEIPGKVRGLVDKAFGNNAYDQALSIYHGMDYARYGLRESIERTEGTPPSQAVPANLGHTHILVISQYFYPETFRVNDLAQEWVRRGYRVTVLTGIPNYPMGKFFEGYGYTSHRHEVWNGIEVIRVPLIPRGSSALGMVANYLSFMASGAVWDALNNIHADYVFTSEVSPMTQALVGCWYGRLHHVPSYLYVQDLWPENVEVITGITNPLAIGPIDRMVDYIYRNTDEIFTTSPSFVKAIVSRKHPVPAAKVHYWPQYAEDFYRPIGRREAEAFLRKAGESDDELFDATTFKVGFTGNIGQAQGLDILPRVAELLQKEGRGGIRFIMVGDGRYQAAFEEEARRRGVDRLFVMVPRQPSERVPYYLALCDVAFISFKDTELFKMTIPAKLQSYLACGKPIIASAEGETEKIVSEARCGICCRIGDAEALAEGIAGLMERDDLEAMGKNARAYFEAHFTRQRLMDDIDTWFSQQ